MHLHPVWEQQSWRTQEKLLGQGSLHAPSCQPQSCVPFKLNGFIPVAFGQAHCRDGQCWLLWQGRLLGRVVHGVCVLV